MEWQKENETLFLTFLSAACLIKRIMQTSDMTRQNIVFLYISQVQLILKISDWVKSI